MSLTVTHPPVRTPSRPVRVLISDVLRSAADRIGSYQVGAPCPHNDGERLFAHPAQPSMVVCPARGSVFPARPR